MAGIGLAGLLTTGVIVHFDVQSPEWEAVSFMLRNYPDDPGTVKAAGKTSHHLLSDVYGMQNTTNFDDYARHVRDALAEPGLDAQDMTGFSDHYVRPDLEKVILILDSHDKEFFVNVIKACDYATDSASMYCHKAYHIMRLYNDGNLIKEFGNRMPVDAFPPLPSRIERHLMNPSVIVEWTPEE